LFSIFACRFPNFPPVASSAASPTPVNSAAHSHGESVIGARGVAASGCDIIRIAKKLKENHDGTTDTTRKKIGYSS
jgi:hypothetical protein